MSSYSPLSQTLTNKLTKEDKKTHGIFFTPPTCVQQVLSLINPHLDKTTTILEPSCGSGEFITELQKNFPDSSITGIEYNQTIVDSIQPILSAKNTEIIHADFMKFTTPTHFNLIVGNPPFAVLKKKDVSEEYYPYFDGRPNIFILFIIKSLNLLTKKGILAFVLPKNFLNCHYYDKTRQFISETCDILNISEGIGKYLETQQETIIMMIQKGKTNDNSKYVLNISGFTIFTTGNAAEISSLYDNAHTLEQLGYKVSVGNVVWNQCKDILTTDDTKTRLIYSSDFSNGKLKPKEYKNIDKKNFIKREGTTKPVIAMNRGYGKGSYTFDYCILDTKHPYLLENHVIFIEYLTDTKSHGELLQLYKNLAHSFNDPRTKKFIELYFGNNAMNTTELNSILPIYL